MKETFVPKKFSAPSLALIKSANTIIQEYAAQGFTLTLRQLYYQFVSRALIPNKQTEYKRLGSVISDARLAGLIDWSAIEDRTRFVRRVTTWTSPDEIVEAAAASYCIDPWLNQPVVPEVWIEKDALIGVIEDVCRELRVPYFACRGYSSQSEQYAAGKRMRAAMRTGRMPLILHLGDHDPSGIDMTRDNNDRVSMFAGEEVEVVRLALNMEQVEEFNPPPNPAKESDSRSSGYIERFGDESWELDALDPRHIATLIRDAIEGRINRDVWDDDMAREADEREKVRSAAAWISDQV